MKQKKRIGIIGGGLTGLVAAYRMSKAGHEVQIFESSPTVGGLAAGFEINGTSLERAYHHIFTTDKDIISLVKELGIEDRLVWNQSSMSLYHDKKMYPFNGVVDLLKFSPLHFFERLQMGMSLFFLQKTKKWKKFKKVTAHSWMNKWSGKKAYDLIWKPLLVGKFHNQYDKISMAWLWARIHTRGNSRKSLFDKEKLGYFTGGFQTLIDALNRELVNNGVLIHTNSYVGSVIGGEEVQIECDKKIIKFDKVIVTTPSHVFSRLIEKNVEISSNYLKALESIIYLGAVCYIFSSKQSLSNFYWHTVIDPDSPFIVFVQHTNFISSKNYNNEHVYYIGTYVPHDHKYFKDKDSEIGSEFNSYLGKMFPDFDPKQVTSEHVFKFKNAQHVVDTDYSSKIPNYLTPIKNVYLSNFSQIFPEDRGTNFSVREGNKIAQLIDESMV